jgi:voltage-gated potassium channel
VEEEKKMTRIFTSFIKLPALSRMFVTIVFILVLFGIIIHIIEPKTFPTVFDGIWWALVTTSTIGYGDFVPSGVPGRIVGIILILVGAGFVTTYFVMLSSHAVASQNAYLEGKFEFSGKDHIIIVGWNERVRRTIEHICTITPPLDIILIDETLIQIPVQSKNVHFIRGNPTHDDTLLRANAEKAKTVLISADQHKNESDADMATILTLVAFKGMNPNIYSIVEVLTSQQVNNAKRAGADEVVQTNLLSSYVFINSVISNGLSNTILTILDQLKGSNLTFLPVSSDLIGKTFFDCSQSMLKDRIILLGVIRGKDSYINPPLTFTISSDDELLVMKD